MFTVVFDYEKGCGQYTSRDLAERAKRDVARAILASDTSFDGRSKSDLADEVEAIYLELYVLEIVELPTREAVIQSQIDKHKEKIAELEAKKKKGAT